MANSRVGNYQLEFVISGYSSPTRDHTHAIYVAPTTNPPSGSLPSAIDLQLLGGGTDSLDNVADAYGSFVQNLYSATNVIGSYTLWRYATENSRDFISAGIANTTTSGTGSAVEAQQQTLTFRTAGGSIMKAVFLEGNLTGNNHALLVANATGNSVQRLAAYLMSASGPAIGIDNTFPVVPLFDSRGQNEAVWRKIYRQ